jgi:AcrR family transcriptional regulator
MKQKTMGLRRNLKEAQRREEIINSAIKVFSIKGYDHSSMNDLAADTGYSKALIYWYWDNKAALFNELIDRCMIPYCELLQATLDSKDPFEDKLFRYLREFVVLFNRQNLLNRLVHFGSLHNNTNKPLENFKDKVNSYYQQVLHHLEALIQQGKDSGYLNPELEASSLALLLLLSVEGYIYMSMLEKRMPIEQVLIENLARYLIPGKVKTEIISSRRKSKISKRKS